MSGRFKSVNIDTDGDGVADLFETRTGVFASPENTGSDPEIWDTDGGGFGDGAELAAGSDPRRSARRPCARGRS